MLACDDLLRFGDRVHELAELNRRKLKSLDGVYIREQRESFELQMDGLRKGGKRYFHLQ